MNDALLVAAPSRDMAPAEPVYDGELVDDLPHTARRAVVRRFATWWARSGRLPAALTSRQALRQATKDLIAWVVRSPCRFAGAVSRGTVVAVRGWRRWVRVHDYRDADEQAEKMADKFVEIRALTLFRLKVNAVAIRAGAAAVIVVDLVYGTGGPVDHSRCQAAARRQYRRLVVVHQHGRTYRDERERPYPIQGRRGGRSVMGVSRTRRLALRR
jgi:hypothetical protein